MPRLLIIDESDAVRTVARRILGAFGFTVSESVSALDALVKCQAILPEVVIIDSAMAGALELITSIRAMSKGRKTRILMSVVDTDLRKLVEGKRAGADDILLKPFDRKSLGASLSDLAAAA